MSDEEYDEILKEVAKSAADTGSAASQVVRFSKRIAQLTVHLRQNPKDFSCERGLKKLTARRRRQLDFLKQSDLNAYARLVARLKLRR